MTSAAYVDGVEPLTSQEKQRGKRKKQVLPRFEHPLRRLSVEADIYLAGEYDKARDILVAATGGSTGNGAAGAIAELRFFRSGETRLGGADIPQW